MHIYEFIYLWIGYDYLTILIWIHIWNDYMNSFIYELYVKWIYQFMSAWIDVFEFIWIDSEFLYEFISIWIQK